MGSRGHEHRVDYIFMSENFIEFADDVGPIDEVDLAPSVRRDHMAVAATVCLSLLAQRQNELCQSKSRKLYGKSEGAFASKEEHVFNSRSQTFECSKPRKHQQKR